MIGSINNVKAILNIDGTKHDTLLETILTNESKVIEQYCGQPIEQTSKTIYFDGNGKYDYLLKYTTAVSITSLEYLSDFSANTWTAIDSDNYYLIDNNPLYYLRLINAYNYGDMNYRYTGNIGFSSSNMPSDLIKVATERAAFAFKQTNETGQESSLGITTQTDTDQGIVTKTRQYKDILPDHERILNKYLPIIF